jgi:RNA polymerase sigma factor (sigma-70 family)
MRRSDSDLMAIPEHQLRDLSPDELVRIVVIGRGSQDKSEKERARAAWGALVATDFDRIRNIVVTFRFPGQPNVSVEGGDVDDTVQAAYERLLEGLFKSFRGASIGEYRAAARTAVTYQCMDSCRDKMRHEQKTGGSLDERVPGKDGEPRGRFDSELAERALRRLEEEEERQRAQEHARDELARVNAALDRIPSEDMREVLRMTWAKRSVEEIAAELGTTNENVYQLRSRGLKQLKQILESEGHPAGDGESSDDEHR